MDYQIIMHDDFVEVVLSRQVTCDSIWEEHRSEIADRLGAMSRPALVINMRDLSYITSTGLGMLVSMFKFVARMNGEFGLVEVPPKIHAVLSVAGINQVLNVHCTAEDFEKSVLCTSRDGIA